MVQNLHDLQIDFLSDVHVKIDVEVGRMHKLLIEILSLKEGDIVAFDKNIEEYITIRLNQKEFAIGELVIANEKYGVRIVDLAR